ncbi:cation-translocating P-type ATPase [Flavitalea sp. BT771]|uniref:cation-translocating P-type ATPase n=1 Tax=Flavitalea sp. BT771 TaxID=3063329 RepID=UPI0026E1D0E6|nr:cation-translocating P-type ATPase [Flavitalea sp. BT771]MDO6429493.1 cation-translocating P-type ATPase [Flavitalea sp. BT771]MDV6218379.1 cation-translocating P-type ATPase [Flavitalea sp. BT771]
MEKQILTPSPPAPELSGLSAADAARLQALYGKNILQLKSRYGLISILLGTFKEPMFILLSGACLLYFILGEIGQGLLMLVALALVAAISVYQELRSSRALAALRKYTAPLATVVRDGQVRSIPAEDLVPGDVIIVEEGERLPADARIIRANDLSMNESLVTGESMPVDKDGSEGNNALYQGTTVNTGKGYAKVTATGMDTVLGRLGRSIEDIPVPPTQLQAWIVRFVRAMAIFGLSAFILVWLISYSHTGNMTLSLLTGLTLAMSAIPEEIPVAFSSFMALGAYRMAALGIVVRHPRIIENLGALSVICLDKTGTLTENRMQVRSLDDATTGRREDWKEGTPWSGSRVLWFARLACEAEPFDAMEKAIVEALSTVKEGPDYHSLRMVHEYPLGGRPPMMTHVYESPAGKVAAAKGAPERILRVCRMPAALRVQWQDTVGSLAASGYRVLAVCSAENITGDYPSEQDGFQWRLEGLLALYDPPKSNLEKVFGEWQTAGITVKILSGDYPGTVMNIARQAGMTGGTLLITGDEVMGLSAQELQDRVRETHLFARMFPDAKKKVVDALKANGEIVAMSGDGVNDGPALRSAHVGIAMGKKGTEIAREAADLIISDDNLEMISESIRHGRSIRNNLGKAVRYLVSIHIPIILTASLPLLLGWPYPILFSPIHIIFIELIMGPTCSIFYEREPMDKDIMQLSGKPAGKSLLQGRALPLTLAQGIVGACGLLALYYFFMHRGYSLEYTRTIVFIALLIDNVLLTFAGRSSYNTAALTIRRSNALTPFILLSSAAFICIIYFIPFARHLFGLSDIRPVHALAMAGVSLISAGWFGLYKFLRARLHQLP